jgi:uncharacterized protein (UPF0332 family)
MSPSANNEILKAIEKAGDAIENAEYNFKGGFYLATANRAYYACFYCMTALLYTKNIYAKTHQGIRAKFSEHFIKTGVFPVDVSDSIAMFFDYRQEADYDLDADITADETVTIIEKARSFYILCKAYYQEIG